jgi:hypothetical protein
LFCISIKICYRWNNFSWSWMLKRVIWRLRNNYFMIRNIKITCLISSIRN